MSAHVHEWTPVRRRRGRFTCVCGARGLTCQDGVRVAQPRVRRRIAPGAVFGLVTVIGEAARDAKHPRKRRVTAACDCGVTFTVILDNLIRGNTKSCGTCVAAVSRRSARLEHGHSKPRTPTFITWCSMRDRCLSPTSRAFADYGGRGISICEEWGDYERFLSDMGVRPAGTSIDRIDVNGHYEPSNCRWSTPAEQARNTRNTQFEAHEPDQIRWLASCGFKASEIALLYGVSTGSVRSIAAGKTWRGL